MISDPKNIKNEVLHKNIALSVLKMYLLMLRMAAILNIVICSGSGGLSQQTQPLIKFSTLQTEKKGIAHNHRNFSSIYAVADAACGGHFEYRDL